MCWKNLKNITNEEDDKKESKKKSDYKEDND